MDSRDVLGQRCQRIPQLEGALHPLLALHCLEEPPPEQAGSAQDPIMTQQAFDVVYEGLAHTEDAHEDGGQVQSKDGEGDGRCQGDHVAGGEHQRRCEECCHHREQDGKKRQTRVVAKEHAHKEWTTLGNCGRCIPIEGLLPLG